MTVISDYTCNTWTLGCYSLMCCLLFCKEGPKWVWRDAGWGLKWRRDCGIQEMLAAGYEMKLWAPFHRRDVGCFEIDDQKQLVMQTLTNVVPQFSWMFFINFKNKFHLHFIRSICFCRSNFGGLWDTAKGLVNKCSDCLWFENELKNWTVYRQNFHHFTLNDLFPFSCGEKKIVECYRFWVVLKMIFETTASRRCNTFSAAAAFFGAKCSLVFLHKFPSNVLASSAFSCFQFDCNFVKFCLEKFSSMCRMCHLFPNYPDMGILRQWLDIVGNQVSRELLMIG